MKKNIIALSKLKCQKIEQQQKIEIEDGRSAAYS